MTKTASRLAAGQEALARGAWQDSREAFEFALREGETAEAHEGLSWAAWALNDGDLTIRSRDAAFRLYREAGDRVAAARMALWLAADYEDFRREPTVASGWRERAGRLLEGLPTAPEHGWLALSEADAALLLREDPTAARDHAARAIVLSKECGAGDVEIVALAVEGLALVAAGDIGDGMRRLEEAAAAVLARELEDESWANRVLCYLIFACERVRDFDRAARWCETLREIADNMQLSLAQGICRSHYAAVLISRGKWDEAEMQLADSRAMLGDSRPPYIAENVVRLAELRRRQGRHDEAAELFRTIDWFPAALIGLGEIALDAGRPQDAEELAERFLRRTPEASRLQRIAALELLVRAGGLTGRRARAAEALAELTAVSDAVATPPLRAAAALSAAAMAAADRDYDAARALLEDAVDLFGRSGTPYESARARLELAGVLVTLDRLARAREEAALAHEVLEQLGASFSAARAAALLKDVDRRLAPIAEPAPAASPLTGRQIEILRLVSKGRNDREIAVALGLSEHTVHRHVANILTRLDMPTRAAAAAHAATHGLL